MIFYEKYKEIFDSQQVTTISVNGKLYDEIYNVNYQLNKIYQEQLIEQQYTPHLEADAIERKKILEYFKNQKELFKNDLFTRQSVYTPKYEGNENLHACLSLFQLIVRNNKIDIHIHVRSQHFINNFLYDNQTYSLLMDQMNKILKKDKGTIFVKIISLHKEVIS